jgi:hypothetical protein
LPLQILSAYLDEPIFKVLRGPMKDKLKGLVIMACGPAMTIGEHFEKVKALVAE